MSAGGPRWRLRAAAALLCLGLSGMASSDATAPATLRPGAAASGAFGGGAGHAWAVEVGAGELARIDVTLLGAWVRLVVRSPAGIEVTRATTVTERYGTLSVAFIADEAGLFLVTVEPQAASEAAGSYRIELAARRPAIARDRLQIEAEWALAAASELLVRGRLPDLAAGIARGESTLPTWRRLGDEAGEASAHYLIGLGHLLANQHAEAARSLARAAAIWRRTGDRSGLAKTLFQIGRVRRYQGDTRGALAAFEQSSSSSRAAGEPYHEALTLYAIARLDEDTGDLQAALAAYAQALAIYRAQSDASGEALLLDALGNVSQRQGQAAEALDNFERALALARRVGNENLVAEALDRLGTLRLRLGQVYPAVEALAEAIEHYRAAGNPAAEGLARVDLGALLVDLGEAEDGRRLLGDALPLLRDPRDQARARLLLARAAALLGDRAHARELAGAALAKSRAMQHPDGEARALCALGFLHLDEGEPAPAREELAECLALAERTGSLAVEMEALRGLGQAGASSGDPSAGEPSFARALALARQLQDTPAETRVLLDMARARQAADDLAGAKAAIESALAGIESVHAWVAGEHLRAAHFAAQREAYEIEVNVLEQLDRAEPASGLDAQAFATAERARARGMLDFFRQARVDLGEGDPRLAREEERLRLELSARATRRSELLAGTGTATEVAALDREIAALAAAYEIDEARLAASSPTYARLRRPEVRLTEIQREVLDDDTLLLDYFLAEPRSYVWAVTRGSCRSWELPGRERIEVLARRVHDALGQPASDGGAVERPETAELSRLLLGPVARELARRRVAVVADGALAAVPFAALLAPPPLPAPAVPSTGARSVPLVLGHEVVQLPSAAVIRELRRARDGRPRAPAAVALLADPVFESADPRLHGARLEATRAREAAAATLTPLARPAASGPVSPLAMPAITRSATGLHFARLPWTRREAELVAAEARGREVLVALDFQANRALATAAELARFRVVHFATHGVLDARRPDLSSLVLSQVDEQGRPRDGFLRLQDVYRLKLDADLVVLSGCETALGESLRGEGIVGLTRGFFHAGASQVLASLWPVRDRATAELMQRFYHAMLHDRLAPAAALRQAQTAMERQPAWHDPYYWAGFVLAGDWQIPAP